MSGKQKKRERVALREKIIFLEKEANFGNADAQVSLGYLYCGRSALGPMDLDKAFYWLKKAADQDHVEGLMFMAGFYMQREVVEKDIKLGTKYLYAYHKKINSEHYQKSIEIGFTEEDFVDHICWKSRMQELIRNKLKGIGTDDTNFETMRQLTA